MPYQGKHLFADLIFLDNCTNSITDTTPVQDQTPFVESNHLPSLDSDNPSWATLSTENTSGEEDALDLESQPTTPEPMEDKALSSYTTTHRPEATSSQFPYQQSTGSPASGLTLITHKNHSRSCLKRGPSPDSLSVHMVPAKKANTLPLPQLHHTLLNHHPLSPYHSRVDILPWRPTITQAAPPLHLTASQRQQRTPFSSRGISIPSAPTHQVLQPQKPPPPITNSSSIEDWMLVDAALCTQVASARILPTQFPAPWEREGVVVRQTGGTHIALTQFTGLEKGSKGKERARSGWTTPRWSNVGEFKARLDTMYGPGDINRGLGRGPKNVSVIPPNANAVGKRITGGGAIVEEKSACSLTYLAIIFVDPSRQRRVGFCARATCSCQHTRFWGCARLRVDGRRG